ncbi:hypothetical protein HOY80DRAFT_858002, partial [Tuber brumale]
KSSGTATTHEVTGGETKPGKAGSRQDSGQWTGKPQAQHSHGEVATRSGSQLEIK